jgi:tetratricopeptide (TPR) repeat protein
MAAERTTEYQDGQVEEALARTREGNSEEALRIYRRMTASATDPGRKAVGLLGQGWIYFDMLCQEKTARDFARQAMTLLQPIPPSSEVLWLLGYAHSLAAHCEAAGSGNAEGEATRALRFLEQALTGATKREVERDAASSAALVCMLLGRPKEAANYWRRYLTVESDPWYQMQSRIRLAGCYRAAEDFEAAQKAAEAALQSGVADAGLRAQALCELGAVHATAERFEEARKCFETALSGLNTRSILPSELEIATEARLNLIDMLRRLGEDEAADVHFRQALDALVPPNTSYKVGALMWLGAAETHAGQEVHARLCFSEVATAADASEDQRRAARQRISLIEAYQLQDAGDHAEARASLLTLLSRCSESDELRIPALLALAECHIELEAYAAVQDVCESILRSSSTNDSARAQALEKLRYAKGMRLFTQRKYGEALLQFNEILDDKTTFDVYRWNSVLMAGNCCCQLRDFRTARKHYDEILKASGIPRDFKETATEWKQRIPRPWWQRIFWPF